ncbi:MAG TPA: beta-galactosidase [Solirubrobacterales bacterium]|nr:beta-galactosidase [Solirubrobacterales bacterium]
MRRIGVGAIAVLAAIAFAAPASARPPARFFGVVPQAPLGAADLDRIGDAGLSLRLPVTWYGVEPAPGAFDFTELDRVIGAAADRGIAVMPQLGGTPSWVARTPATPPLSAAGLRAWRGFLVRLVDRYGSGGSFWAGRARREPVRRWQIWNEPNFNLYWRPASPYAYARLLHASAATIRAADRQALIVAAAVAPIEHAMRPWAFLERLYRVPGFRRDFDFAAVHPYAVTVSGVAYQVRRARRVMARAGDGRKPLLLTEVGVASAGGRLNPFNRGRAGQARFLSRAFGELLRERRRWRLAGAYWFTWQDCTAPDPTCVFCQYAGLFDKADNPKPAWWALQRLLGKAPVRSRVR